jgi:Fe2+ transport system protein FeoA
VQLLERAPYGGPLRLKVGAKERVIGAELAGTVLVERAAEP